jgi:hypothetical protein
VRRGRGIESRADTARGQLLGSDPIEVAVVDHGKIAGPESLDQLLGAPAESGGAPDRGGGGERHRGEPMSYRVT